MFAKRFLYLGYYLKELDWAKLSRFQQHVRKNTRSSLLSQWYHAIHSVFRYNISIEEYYQFRFFQNRAEENSTYAGTGYMYEYQRKMNPLAYRAVLADKTQFLKKYRAFVRHPFLTVQEIAEAPDKVEALLQNPSGKIVLKSADGQCGRGIEVRPSSDFTPESLLQRLRETGNDFVEAFVTQHTDLMRLSPSGLNTIRIITQLDKNDQVHIIGTRLRITVNSAVDNLAAGNIAAPIDLETGKINGPGVYSDITKADEYQHPVTGVDIVGFQIPYWQETLDLCKAAARLDTRNRSIGWDVAITDEGPELIEGNHDWCKLLWQLPVKKGLKPVLDKFLEELEGHPQMLADECR
jgi:hypothetical protein